MLKISPTSSLNRVHKPCSSIKQRVLVVSRSINKRSIQLMSISSVSRKEFSFSFSRQSQRFYSSASSKIGQTNQGKSNPFFKPFESSSSSSSSSSSNQNQNQNQNLEEKKTKETDYDFALSHAKRPLSEFDKKFIKIVGSKPYRFIEMIALLSVGLFLIALSFEPLYYGALSRGSDWKISYSGIVVDPDSIPNDKKKERIPILANGQVVPSPVIKFTAPVSSDNSSTALSTTVETDTFYCTNFGYVYWFSLFDFLGTVKRELENILLPPIGTHIAVVYDPSAPASRSVVVPGIGTNALVLFGLGLGIFSYGLRPFAGTTMKTVFVSTALGYGAKTLAEVVRGRKTDKDILLAKSKLIEQEKEKRD